MGSLIHDGLTEKAYIGPFERLYGELYIEYRPTTSEQVNRFLDGIKNRNSLAALGKAEVTAVFTKLVSWSLQDDEGNEIPLSVDNVARLQPVLLKRVTNIVIYGTDGGDQDPESQQDSELADIMASAAETGRRISELREERDVKN